jgi:hypothetical protein
VYIYANALMWSSFACVRACVCGGGRESGMQSAICAVTLVLREKRTHSIKRIHFRKRTCSICAVTPPCARPLQDHMFTCAQAAASKGVGFSVSGLGFRPKL